MRGGHAALTAALLIATACAPPAAGTGDPDAASSDDAAAAPRPDHGVLYYGSYGHDDDALVVGQPWLAGALIQVYWSELEPSEGSYQWAALDRRIDVWASAGKHAAVRVMWSTSGAWPDPRAKHPTPAWLLARGAGIAVHTGTATEVPLFWDPAYQAAARRFLAALEGHLATRPGVLFVDVTPGAETNPYRMGTLDDDPAFRTTFTAALASDGSRYDDARWGQALDDYLVAVATSPSAIPRVVTLNQGGLLGAPSRLGTIGDRAVGLGMWVGQNGLRGDSYATEAASARWWGWAAQAPLCFEMSAATGGEVGTMAEVVAAARRVRASFLNTYAVDVLRATPGTATYDPAWAAALAEAAATLGAP